MHRFKQMTYELLRGFAYLKIAHPYMRAYTNWVPLGVFLFCLGVYIVVPVKPILLGEHGTFSSLLTLFATLPGFYFAGLAAVATFGAQSMDKEMPTPAPEITIMVNGKLTPTKLTRRQFLSYLFSYLVIISFILCVYLISMNTLSSTLLSIKTSLYVSQFPNCLWGVLKFIGIIPAVGIISSMTVASLHGIFFLTEKIHQP